MNLLLRAKHWQLFILTTGIPIVVEMVIIALIIVTRDLSVLMYGYMLIMALSAGTLYAWIYKAGVNLQKQLPAGVKMNVTMFRTFLFILVSYVAFFCFVMFYFFHQLQIPFDAFAQSQDPAQPLSQFQHHAPPPFLVHNLALFALMIPVHLFSMFCIIFCVYFVAKALKTVELKKEATFNDFAAEFFLILFFPVGVWFIQPRINKLFEGPGIS